MRSEHGSRSGEVQMVKVLESGWYTDWVGRKSRLARSAQSRHGMGKTHKENMPKYMIGKNSVNFIS